MLLVCTRRTASSLNSFVKVRCSFGIVSLPFCGVVYSNLPHSTKPGPAQVFFAGPLNQADPASLVELRWRSRRVEVPFSTIEREDGEEGLSPLEAIPDHEPLPEEMTESSELHGSLHAAIGSRPPKLRSIIQLRCFRQLTFAEIGQILKMPETTAKAYFYRSLPRLRRALASSVHFASAS